MPILEPYQAVCGGGCYCRSPVHQPPILVLDEPTAGVDIELRHQLWTYVRALNEQGVTIVLTTHYLEEAQALCDRIAIIDHGDLVICDYTLKLLTLLDSKTLCFALTPRSPKFRQALKVTTRLCSRMEG